LLTGYSFVELIKIRLVPQRKTFGDKIFQRQTKLTRDKKETGMTWFTSERLTRLKFHSENSPHAHTHTRIHTHTQTWPFYSFFLHVCLDSAKDLEGNFCQWCKQDFFSRPRFCQVPQKWTFENCCRTTCYRATAFLHPTNTVKAL